MDTAKLKGLWEKVRDFFKNMSKKVRIILAVALTVALLAVLALLLLSGNGKKYTPLYQDMTPTEISEVLTYLQNNGITDYQAAGGTILVRADQYNALLAQLALAGYPRDASLYGSYWDHVGMTSTSSERAEAMRLSTQEKLEGSIRTFTGVQDADVIITPGERRTYVLEDVSSETTAVVKLTLRSGYTLPDETADAIRLMVSKAWSGMTIDSVAVVDTNGNTYSGGAASASDAAELKRVLEEQTANRIRSQVKHVLDPIYDADNVSVGVGCTVDVSRRVTESTSYSQPAGSYESGGLMDHEMGYFALTRDGYELVGGVPGTESNADIPSYVYNEGQNVQDGDGVVTSWEKNNKLNSILEQTEVLAPTVSSLSIAVTIRQDATAESPVDAESLRRHVAMAANIGGEDPEQYVSVLVVPYTPEPADTSPAGLIPQELLPYVIIGGAALVLLLVLIIVILSVRRKKKKQQEEEDQRIIEEQLGELGANALGELGIAVPGTEDGAQPPPTTGADIMEINTERSMELRKAVRQFVQNNPEVAALMLKTWLRGGEDDNG